MSNKKLIINSNGKPLTDGQGDTLVMDGGDLYYVHNGIPIQITDNELILLKPKDEK